MANRNMVFSEGFFNNEITVSLTHFSVSVGENGDDCDELQAGEAAAASKRCSFVGRLLFSWFDCYVAKGKDNALTADEIPALEEEYRLVKMAQGPNGYECYDGLLISHYL